jgi:hypothetical protein
MATTDSSRHMHEQPPFVRLFKIASLFCTRCMKQNFVSMFLSFKLANCEYQALKCLDWLSTNMMLKGDMIYLKT